MLRVFCGVCVMGVHYAFGHLCGAKFQLSTYVISRGTEFHLAAEAVAQSYFAYIRIDDFCATSYYYQSYQVIFITCAVQVHVLEPRRKLSIYVYSMLIYCDHALVRNIIRIVAMHTIIV